ncbi:MAG: carbohydrate ABC transporter permease [Actinomycetia bacterium]|nr:carbohydrate ABC transporter permease [Actinomycetes bacterium]
MTAQTAGVHRSRKWVYIPLTMMALFYLLPMFVMLNTGFKSFEEVSLATMWELPSALSLDNFTAAWEILSPNVWNSLKIVIPAATISSILGSINGYVLSKWKFPGANIVFPVLLFGMFIPYQSILIPLVDVMSRIGLAGSIWGLVLVHVIYGIPITTLIFRNYYAAVPDSLIEAATVDGAGIWQVYWRVLLPLSIPAFVVVYIWQFTSAWNDFLFAVLLTSTQNWPVTVALNNMAGSQIIAWNVQMAGSFLAAVPTLLIYIFLGRYFLRGMMTGALKE